MQMASRRFLPVLVVSLLGLLPRAVAAQDLQGDRANALGTSLRPSPRAAATVGSDSKDRHPKLTTTLAELVDWSTALRPGQARVQARVIGGSLPTQLRAALRSGVLDIDLSGRVQVNILSNQISDAQLASFGVIVELRANGVIQARVPVDRLAELAKLTEVDAIRLPDYAYPRSGGTTTQGDAILRGDSTRSIYLQQGAGIRIGVISDGVAGAATAAGSGDLPAGGVQQLPNTSTPAQVTAALVAGPTRIIAASFRANGSLTQAPGGANLSEGTAMLEIIHDIAPKARLLFANSGTSTEFNQAVNWLHANCDIVVDDLGFYNLGPYDGTSALSANITAALANAGNRSLLHVTANGNDAEVHYQGTFVAGEAGPTFGLPAGRMNVFTDNSTVGGSLPKRTFSVGAAGDTSSSNTIVVPDSGSIRIFLQWPQVTRDYDLYLLNGAGVVVASSTDLQNGGGGQQPHEFLTFQDPKDGRDTVLFIAILNFNNAAAASEFDMYVLGDLGASTARGFRQRLRFDTPGSSITHPTDTLGPDVVTVGAIDQGDAGHNDIESFSSRGPTDDGRQRPDIAGIDGVAVTGAGGFSSPFFGTSASAPHIAGILGQIYGANPNLTAAGLRSALIANVGAAAATLNEPQATGAITISTRAQTFGAGRANSRRATRSVLPDINVAAATLPAIDKEQVMDFMMQDSPPTADQFAVQLIFSAEAIGDATAGAVANLQPQPYPGDFGPGEDFVRRFFTISNSGGAGTFTTRMRLYYLQSEFDGSNLSDESLLVIYRWNGGGSNTKADWDLVPSTPHPNENYVEADGVTSFTRFAIGNFGGDVPLAVTLASFTARPQGSSGVSLSWTVQSERDNAGFMLERASVAGGVAGAFHEINSFDRDPALRGRGTSSSAKTYAAVDSRVQPGQTYRYRLTDVGLDGSRHVEPTQPTVTLAAADGAAPVAFRLWPNQPNPFNPTTSIRLSLPEPTEGHVLIYSTLGQIVRDLPVASGQPGTVEVTWDGRDGQGQTVSSGIYLYRFTGLSPSGNRFSAARQMLLMK